LVGHRCSLAAASSSRLNTYWMRASSITEFAPVSGALRSVARETGMAVARRAVVPAARSLAGACEGEPGMGGWQLLRSGRSFSGILHFHRVRSASYSCVQNDPPWKRSPIVSWGSFACAAIAWERKSCERPFAR
jgi:hypothetical protein